MIVIARRHYRLLLARSFNALQPFNKPGSKTGPIVKSDKKAKLDRPWSRTIRKGRPGAINLQLHRRRGGHDDDGGDGDDNGFDVVGYSGTSMMRARKLIVIIKFKYFFLIPTHAIITARCPVEQCRARATRPADDVNYYWAVNENGRVNNHVQRAAIRVCISKLTAGDDHETDTECTTNFVTIIIITIIKIV